MESFHGACIKEAAETESIHNIRTFNQVLKFDTSKHVKYFPGLWKGDTPMAPVNPSYSKKAEESKNIMFTTLKSDLPSLTLCEIFDNIDLLWDGILSENFIFNFKNSLCIKAYDGLEKQFQKILSSVQKRIIAVRRSKETKLNKEEGQSDYELLVSELKREGAKVQEEKKKELEEFFQENQYKDTLEDWRVKRLLAFDERVTDLIENEAIVLKRYGQEIPLRKDIEKKLVDYRRTMAEHAKQLADEFKDDDEEDKLQRAFDEKWEKWIGKLAIPESANTWEKRRAFAVNQLTDHFYKDGTIVDAELRSTGLIQNSLQYSEKNYREE